LDLDDSPAEAEFRRSLRNYLTIIAEPRPAHEPLRVSDFAPHLGDGIPVSEQQKWQGLLAAGGWGAPTWPAEYGGRDATPTEALIYRQELDRFTIPPLGVFGIGLGMVGPTLIAHGTPEQKQRWIPHIVDGTEIWCQLWSEPNAGSDLAAVQTRAERQPSGDWKINGQKVWTTGAQHSHWGLCLARTNAAASKHRGLSVFVVNMHAPGVTIRPIRQLTGDEEFNEVFFDDTVAPADQLVGPVDAGWSVAITTLMNERYAGGIFGDATHLVQPLIGLVRDGTAWDSPAIRQRVAGIYVIAKLLTLTGYRSLSDATTRGKPGPEGSILKLALTDLLMDICRAGSEMLELDAIAEGPDAPDQGFWSYLSLGLLSMKIGGGTDDILRNIIGERVLGLPKDRSDR
jgi:alkylation response protein AidB-like acyl-CoA dehydrogenase